MSPPKAQEGREETAFGSEEMARRQQTAREKPRNPPSKFALFFKISKIVFESGDWFAKIADTHGHGELSERPKEHAC